MRSHRLLFALLALSAGCASAPPAVSTSRAAQAVTDSGTVAGAPYRIDIPAGWNGGLVMYAHGYEIVGTAFEPAAPRHAGFREAFTSRGFAFAQSWYRAQGWAVREGIEDTEALRRHFVRRYGRPDTTFVTGHSMGGLITLATIEGRPAQYHGALPLCGVLSPTLEAMRTMFDLLVSFDYLYPGVLTTSPRGLVDLPAAPAPGRDAIVAAVRAHPERAEALANRYALQPRSIPGLVWFFATILRELEERAGGNPFDNRGTVYRGLGDDTASARGVRRYAPDPAAVQYLRSRYTPTGRIADPVLAVHTTYDATVPPEQMDRYRTLAQLAGTEDRFAAAYVVADGHCNFTPAQVGAAFDALRAWAATGRRPAEGEIIP
ncbi:MAG: prolyl oligopeptidase family serine peptidase [Gemmatimonadetes bacterium]|nr:prolyl oligopeptidase family serine peptidase [Gemmatimonadota bacterium]